MPWVPATFSGLCRAKTGGLALHFKLESAISSREALAFTYLWNEKTFKIILLCSFEWAYWPDSTGET